MHVCERHMVHAKKLCISQNVDHRWGMIFFCKLEIRWPFGTNEVLIIAESSIFVQCICHSYLMKLHWPQASSPFKDAECWGVSCVIGWIKMGCRFFGDDKAGKGKKNCYFPFFCRSWKAGLLQNSACTYWKKCISSQNYGFNFFEHLEFTNSKVFRYLIFDFDGT